MTSTPVRRRAPGMAPDERRAMIVAAALPLVAEHGAAVTTSRIARAAGIGEATIFRVFEDKEAVLEACFAAAVDPHHALRELAAIPLDSPLEDRLVEAAEAMHAHFERMGVVVGLLHGSGHLREESARRPEPGAREESMRLLHEGVTELVEPDRATLCLPPEDVASLFLGMLFARLHPAGGERTWSPAALVHVLLHGSLRTTGGHS